MHYKEAKGILSPKGGMNIYRGCSHGCIYCDARSSCYNFEHPFEDIEVKINAPELLEASLRKKRKRIMVGTGSMSDPYMHIEKELKLTRRCLEIIDKYECGVAIQTKSNMILRDLDLLKSINKKTKCVVQMTLTTFDEDICKIVEPNVCTTKERFKVLEIMRDEGIPTVLWLTPILPFINDTEENIRGILDYAKRAKVYGIISFGFGLTLREGDREYFYEKLDKYYPGLKEKYQRRYGTSYELQSDRLKHFYKTFLEECKKNNIETDVNKIFEYMHEFPEDCYPEQLSLF